MSIRKRIAGLVLATAIFGGTAAVVTNVAPAGAHSFPGVPHIHTSCSSHDANHFCYRWIRVNGVIVQGPFENFLVEAAGGFVLVGCASAYWHTAAASPPWPPDWYSSVSNAHWHWSTVSNHTFCQNPKYTSGVFNGLPWSMGPT